VTRTAPWTSAIGAVSALAVLTLVSAAPASAETLSHAEASAVRGSVAGQPADSGTVRAVDEGNGVRVTGTSNPPAAVLGNQRLLNVGVLAQEATAGVVDGAGTSAACAGVAGNGGSVAQVGSSRCLTPGQPVGLSIANLDLTGAVVADPASSLAPLNGLQPVVDQLVGPVTHAVSQGLAPLGETGLAGTVGAIEARCVAGATGVDGSSHITDGRLTLSLGGTAVDVVDLPVEPAPNTELFVNLDQVGTAVLDGLRAQLTQTLDGQAASLAAAIDPVQQQIVDGVLAQVGPQLKPLSDNVLKLVLNKQVRTADSIQVTALSLEVLPAAAQAADAPLATVDVGHVACGPNGRVAEVAQAVPAAPEKPAKKLPRVPAVVASGVADAPEPWYHGLAGPAAVVLLAAGVGALGGFRGSHR
jgi:hypothetical protein